MCLYLDNTRLPLGDQLPISTYSASNIFMLPSIVNDCVSSLNEHEEHSMIVLYGVYAFSASYIGSICTIVRGLRHCGHMGDLSPDLSHMFAKILKIKKNEKIMSEKEILAKVFDLEKMLDYQDGSVVSRTLINKDIGTVTLFSFDKDEGLSEHTAPFDALVYVFDGEAEISISKQKNIVKEGQMIIMPAHEPHALKALSKFKMMLVMIRS